MYDENGNEIWSVRNSSGDFGAYDIALDEFNNIYLGGGQSANFCTIKINSGIVPVELISFSAVQENKNVILSWTTATETNNYGFEVERLTDTWEKIGFVPGFGTTSEKKNYSFNDHLTKYGKYSYRLKQVDYNGTCEYSKVIEIEFQFTPAEFVLFQNFPNPFNPNTVISFCLPVAADVTIKLYNSLGEELSIITQGKYNPGINYINFQAGNFIS
jgi:hypothetical protein